jgi:hypothetical protein
VRVFAARRERDPRAFAGITSAVVLGPYTLGNVATRFEPLRGASVARIGLDLLGRLAPTFDPRAGRLLLRRSGRVDDAERTLRIATLTTRGGVLVVKGETVMPIGHPDVQQYLRNAKWTLDWRRGSVVVESVGKVGGIGDNDFR